MKLKMKKNPNSNKKSKETNQPKYESYYEYFDTKTQERVRLVWKNN